MARQRVFLFDTDSTAPALRFAELVLRAGMEGITPQIARNQFGHCRIRGRLIMKDEINFIMRYHQTMPKCI